MCIQLLNTYMYEQQTSVQPALISARQRAFGQQNQGLFGVNKKLAEIKKNDMAVVKTIESKTTQVSNAIRACRTAQQQQSNSCNAILKS